MKAYITRTEMVDALKYAEALIQTELRASRHILRNSRLLLDYWRKKDGYLKDCGLPRERTNWHLNKATLEFYEALDALWLDQVRAQAIGRLVRDC